MVTNSNYQSGQNDQSLAQLPKRKAGSKLTSGHLLMIISGLATFLLVIIVLGSQGKTITVFVANNQIPVGQQITAQDFKPTEIPSSSLDSQYFKAKDFLGETKIYAARTIEKNEPLLIIAKNTKTAASNVRLISLPIDKTKAVNGALAKGDQIDIIETPDGGCAYRVMAGLNIASVSGGTSSGGLGGGTSAYTLIISLTSEDDESKLDGIISRGQYQLVRVTGVEGNTTSAIEDKDCGFGPEDTVEE